jgi:poly(A) polymerase/tRNA nucleotidyltransferase (CCA-adding enzyme)
MTREAELLAQAFGEDDVVSALRYLYAQGVLDKFGPFSRLEGMSQGKYHHLDALEHSFEVVRNLKKYGANKTLMLAGLFHDTGKADTREPGEDGKVHFFGHEDYSQDYLREAASKYDFEGAGFEVGKALVLVKHHMLEEARVQKSKGRGKVRREIGADEDLFDLLVLKGADKASGALPERAEYWLGEVADRFREDIEKEKEFSKKDMAVTGKDLIDMGIPAGPALGQTLNHLFEMAKDNPVMNTRENLLMEAEEFAVQNLQLDLG